MTNEHMYRSDLSASDCYSLIDRQRIGRLAIIEYGYPVAIPVGHRLTGSRSNRRVVIRTAPSTTIAQYEGPASLQVDLIDERERTAWSVIARGTLHRIVGDETLPDPQPWVIEGRHQWVALDIVAVSGRCFAGRPTRDNAGLEWRFK